ncbi:putative zinc finger protein CONSTANS-LIKE 11 [Acorus calamus]|uniref:Zinc finger protein CONSTANS-LIKE 11 n=1 Tax=Acorus calamus TaxID=4465 RepID=A0AAV9DTV4_ACOCL|nr:putative zinc finger protein CONSTANS-LIKE 11 [Acorus calamus]
MKECELCRGTARMYCESDSASLCWDCDARVHGANFLVAKHCRRLLCQSCQEPTPWTAAGARLGPTFSICARCYEKSPSAAAAAAAADNRDQRSEIGGGAEDEEEEEDLSSDSEDDEEEDGENQVVPWTDSSPAGAPPLPVTSSSSSEESSVQIGDSLKRMRDVDADLDFQDNLRRRSSQPSHHEWDTPWSSAEDEATSPSRPFRASKRGTTSEATASEAATESVFIGSFNRFLEDASPRPPI